MLSFLGRMRFLTAAVVVAVAMLALFALQPSSTARADTDDISKLSCTFATPPAPGVQDTITCTFDFAGSPHTFVAVFTFSLTTRPPLTVSSCTLDGKAVHIGPCP